MKINSKKGKFYTLGKFAEKAGVTLIYRYKDSLKVTEVGPLMDYVLYSPSNLREVLNEKDFKELEELFRNIIEKEGYMFITKDSGIIEAKKR